MSPRHLFGSREWRYKARRSQRWTASFPWVECVSRNGFLTLFPYYHLLGKIVLTSQTWLTRRTDRNGERRFSGIFPSLEATFHPAKSDCTIDRDLWVGLRKGEIVVTKSSRIFYFSQQINNHTLINWQLPWSCSLSMSTASGVGYTKIVFGWPTISWSWGNFSWGNLFPFKTIHFSGFNPNVSMGAVLRFLVSSKGCCRM